MSKLSKLQQFILDHADGQPIYTHQSVYFPVDWDCKNKPSYMRATNIMRTFFGPTWRFAVCRASFCRALRRLEKRGFIERTTKADMRLTPAMLTTMEEIMAKRAQSPTTTEPAT